MFYLYNIEQFTSPDFVFPSVKLSSCTKKKNKKKNPLGNFLALTFSFYEGESLK